MRINKKLNLVIPCDCEVGKIYVHSTPVAYEIFEQYYLPLSKTFANLFSQGLGVLASPRVAYLALKSISEEMGVWNGPQGVHSGFVNEFIRLSNVAVTGKNGWETLPLHVAMQKNIIDEETSREVLSAITFFMLIALMNRPKQTEAMMEAVNGLWQTETTYLDFTEFLTSLKMSIEEENTGATVTTSSVPS